MIKLCHSCHSSLAIASQPSIAAEVRNPIAVAEASFLVAPAAAGSISPQVSALAV